MADHHDLPYQAEYAKSNRSTCKACKINIDKGSLRLAVMVQSQAFDGKVPNWFHYHCFWKRAKVEIHQDIHNFDALRWEDQQKIKDKIAGGSGGIDEKSAAAGGTGPSVSDYKAEYAKSNRSTCRGCTEKIAKDELRLSKKDFSSQRAKMYGPQDTWYHVDCFIKEREEIGFGTDKGVSAFAGYNNLKKPDQEELLEKFGKGTSSATSSNGSGKKRKGEGKGDAEPKKKKEETEEEKVMKKQSKLLWGYHDKLQKGVSNEALQLLLELNHQKVPSGESRLLDAVSDCMAFGSLEPCPNCPNGQLAYRSDGYHCTGNLTNWTKCLYITRTPKRKPFKIPKEYHDVEVLKEYKYKSRDRVFPAVVVRSTEGPVSSMDCVDGRTSKPLENLNFVIIGNLDSSEEQITTTIRTLGGKVIAKIDNTVAACISNKETVEKMGKSMKLAKKSGIHVVDTKFLDDVKNGGVVLMILKHSIAPWGDDPQKRIIEPTIMKSGSKMSKNSKDDDYFTKSIPDKVRMKVKGGAAVEPDSGLAETAHVIQDKSEIYNAVLGLVDIISGTNSYYKIQALESDTKSCWWIFRSWGRVGTTIGSNKVERCGSRKSAIDNFKALYSDKTNNEWDNRQNFQKFPNKFYPLEIDYGQDDDNLKKLDLSKSKSKLHKAIQDLVRIIFDIESMKKAMMEFEIDLKKMPLGKLSKKQIESAYKVLNELNELLDETSNTTLCLDASTKFYTLIPHDFGMNKPPLLDTKDIITKKTEMLDNLMEIEIAYSLLKSGDDGKDPIDASYEKLKTDIEFLEKDTDEFKRLQDYVKNTHAATHNQYDLEIMDAFKVARNGEYQRYRPFEELPNRKLLWHGSRVTNFAGILSQGLRIAPPEAPVTGYMFGKGIYFADMVSKSANYCHTCKNDSVGLILLCDVALGNMHELTAANYITSLPKGKHSTKGCGTTIPDPKGSYTGDDGVEIPMGKGVPSNVNNSSLLYNEYIVYDIAQVNIKYLLKMKFNYKW